MPEMSLTPPCIVVLSTQTLFAEGLVAKLRQNAEKYQLRSLDAQLPDVMAQLAAYQPSLVLLDATDVSVCDRHLLDDLLTALPALTIVRLDPQQGQLQVVTSQQRTITRMADMVAVIDSLIQPTLAGDVPHV
jgi:hypothetical protein